MICRENYEPNKNPDQEFFQASTSYQNSIEDRKQKPNNKQGRSLVQPKWDTAEKYPKLL